MYQYCKPCLLNIGATQRNNFSRIKLILVRKLPFLYIAIIKTTYIYSSSSCSVCPIFSVAAAGSLSCQSFALPSPCSAHHWQLCCVSQGQTHRV